MKHIEHFFRAEDPRELAVIGAVTDHFHVTHQATPGTMPTRLSQYLVMLWCCEAWRCRNEPASLNELATRGAEVGSAMRRTVTHSLHTWSQKDSKGRAILRIEGDLVYPGRLARDYRYQDMTESAARHREALGLIPEHGAGEALLHTQLDPRWMLFLRQVIALAMGRGVTTLRQLTATLYLCYCSIAGSKWVAGHLIAEYVGVETRRVTDMFEIWEGDGIDHRRSPGDERRVDFRMLMPRSEITEFITDHLWYLDNVFDVPKDFQPHQTFGLPSLNRGELKLVRP